MTTEWIIVKSFDDLPKKKTKSYEQYDCLVSYKGEVLHRVWNCEHGVWDDSSGDDFFCEALEVEGYMLFPQPLPAQKLREGK